MLKSRLRRFRLIVFLAAAFALPAARLAAADLPKETPAELAARMKWFNEARFGMFIHWGVYSVPAGEWNGHKDYAEWFLEETHMPVSQYEKFAQQFNPVKFDAKQWVAIAKDAGMKYIVITSKHHDGFGMFPSKETDWCIKITPFKRDPLKELSAACREAGIKFCLYHSIMDWHHPDWGTRRAWNDKATGKPDMDRYTAYMKRQLKELAHQLRAAGHPLVRRRVGIALDHRARRRPLRLRPLACSRTSSSTTASARPARASPGWTRAAARATTARPSRTCRPTGFGPGVYWESCMTMNDHWGYNKNDHNLEIDQDLIHILVDCASKGGNYLLNVGPTSEGLIPPTSVERLKEMGDWMKVNGESIYGTTATTIGKPKWGRSTTKGKRIYLHVFDWPKGGVLEIDHFPKNVSKAWLLSDNGKKTLPVVIMVGSGTTTLRQLSNTEEKPPSGNVEVKAIKELPKGNAFITVPEKAPDKIDTVIVLE